MSTPTRKYRRTWREGFSVLVSILTLLILMTLPASAITYGEPDGNGHPAVGSMVVDVPGMGLLQWCSGTLIAEKVFMTAAHCTAFLDPFMAAYPGTTMFVTFDPTISESGSFYTGQWFTNPNYDKYQGGGGQADPADVAVIVLDQSPGITPARLPTAGLLDQLKDAHLLKQTRFTTVGYGTTRESNKKGPAAIGDNLDRNRVDQDYLALTTARLQLAMTYNTGNGGTCYGDSGGPHFIHLDGVESDIIVSITAVGDYPCKALDTTYRVDTAAARSFLGQFVQLP